MPCCNCRKKKRQQQQQQQNPKKHIVANIQPQQNKNATQGLTPINTKIDYRQAPSPPSEVTTTIPRSENVPAVTPKHKDLLLTKKDGSVAKKDGFVSEKINNATTKSATITENPIPATTKAAPIIEKEKNAITNNAATKTALISPDPSAKTTGIPPIETTNPNQRTDKGVGVPASGTVRNVYNKKSDEDKEPKTSDSTAPKDQDTVLYEQMEIEPTKQINDITAKSATDSASYSKAKDWGDYDRDRVDYDAIYNITEVENTDGPNNKQRTVIMHILSQLAVGTDLSKVSLPTFILERRSLLEKYADFFAHPDNLIAAVDLACPEKRFLAMVQYYLNSFSYKSAIAKKPYNPVLGETFRCRWTLPGKDPTKGPKTRNGPFPGSSFDQVTFVAEQVSHHPPISAFYAEHPAAGVTCTAHIYTKSSFLGLSIGVSMIGRATVKLLEFNEEYVFTFPKAYARSMLSTPWIEFGGKAEIRCDKTHYRAEIEFLTKPLIGGSAHHIEGLIYHDEVDTTQKRDQKSRKSKPVMYLKGKWNGRVLLRKRRNQGRFNFFSDVREKPEMPKECMPVKEQENMESRKLWRHVSAALYKNDAKLATEAKHWIEQCQRNELAKRTKAGELWRTRFFERIGEGEAKPTDAWRYREDLEQRRKRNNSKSDD